MICYQSDAPDCRHLIKTAPMSCMSPKRNKCDIDQSHPVECLFYEPGAMTNEQANVIIRQYFEEGLADLDRQLKEFDEWRDRCIRGGVRAGVIVLVLYALFVCWMLI